MFFYVEMDTPPVSPVVKIIGASVGGSLLLLASVGVMSGLLIYKKRKVEVHVHTITTSVSPSHIVFNKSDNIRDEIDMAGTLQVRNTDDLKYQKVSDLFSS